MSFSLAALWPRRLPSRSAMLLCFALPLALFTGAVVGLGLKQLILVLLGLLLAPAVLLVPSRWLLTLMLFVATVGAGCLQYFGRIEQAHWLPTLLLAAMVVRIPFDALRTQSFAGESARWDGLAWCVVGFVGLVVVSAAMNLTKPLQFLVGLRHYVFPLALVAAVLQARADAGYWLRVVHAVPWLVLLQLPLCFYQYFFVARQRGAAVFGATGISWDAVVGSFGGNPEGGGASGALALFLAFGIAVTALLRSQGRISAWMAAITWGAAALSAVMAEIKVLIVFLPLALLLVNRARLLRSPVRLLAWTLATGVTAFALLSAYSWLHYQARGGASGGSVLGEVERMTQSERDVRFYNPLTGEVSRVGALVLWGDAHWGRDFGVKTLVGWGPAASKSSTLFGAGPAAKGKRYTLTTHSGSQLLWDLGLTGLLAFGAMALLAVREALSLAARTEVKPALGLLAEVAALGPWLVLAGLFYNGDAINNPAVQACWRLSGLDLVAAT